jgi:hypothetical protein
VARARVAEGLLNLAIIGAGLAVLALLYGLAARTFIPRTAPVRAESEAAPRGDVIQVEVLNGAGVAGLAAEGTRFLRARGFDVVLQGNHAPAEQTRVLDRIGDPEPARRVAAALGVGEELVATDADPGRDVDVSVILGSDHTELIPFRRDDDP